ncbi:MAG: hypothetical protein HWN67_16710 [Candidatus Helarchaeota archaeon]|nr:hypothetical protein [Candidatus Helarchaeota archaeon]
MFEIIMEEDELKAVLVNGKELEILDYNGAFIITEASLSELEDIQTIDFPDNLIIQVHSTDGFGTYLFHELHISKDGDGVCLKFFCHTPNKYWEGRWGLATFLDAIRKQAEYIDDIDVGSIELEDDWKRLSLLFSIEPSQNLTECIFSSAKQINSLIKEAEVALSGMSWKKEFETNEPLFCTEVLAPLLRRMGFISVRYRHGTKEYGKDFTFSELTPFGQLRHYGLQAKTGNVSGEVNSEIDEILGQMEDAFSMPYYEVGSKEPRYISVFIIAISGRYTENAKEKIVEKMPKGVIGSVYFLDREAIIELIERYWLLKE